MAKRPARAADYHQFAKRMKRNAVVGMVASSGILGGTWLLGVAPLAVAAAIAMGVFLTSWISTDIWYHGEGYGLVFKRRERRARRKFLQESAHPQLPPGEASLEDEDEDEDTSAD